MALQPKPDISQIWASGGSLVEPSDTKKQTGWTAEVPPFQWENWIQRRQDQFLAHVNQRGLPVWDGLTEYEAGGLSYVQGSDGKIYNSVLASGPSTTVQDPTTDVGEVYWTEPFSKVVQATESVAGIAELATTGQAQAGTDDLTIMTPLKTKQAIDEFTGEQLLDSVRINVASASSVDLVALAPDTRYIQITGDVTINDFVIENGQKYFVRFSGSPLLTNSASLVAQYGENIQVEPGDTCVIAATADNVVEVLFFTRNRPIFSREYVSPPQSPSLGGVVTLTHGLGGKPRNIRFIAVCLVADGIYAPGNEVDIPAHLEFTSAGYGFQFQQSETQIIVRFGNTAVFTIRTAGSVGLAVPSRWEFRIEAAR